VSIQSVLHLANIDALALASPPGSVECIRMNGTTQWRALIPTNRKTDRKVSEDVASANCDRT